jgi:hypothetical protein
MLNNPALWKRNVPLGRTLDNNATPSNATAGVAINPTINDNTINGKSTVDNTAPSNATGGNTANPTINNNTGRGATSSNGTADVVCDTSNTTTGVDSDNKETSNAAINMAASSPTAESSTNTQVDNTVAAASNNNDNNVAVAVQVASQMVSMLCTIIRSKLILNLNYFIFNKYSHTNLIFLSPCMTLRLLSSWWNKWNCHLKQIIQKWNYFTSNNRQRQRPLQSLPRQHL